jgi:hypothetical protein
VCISSKYRKEDFHPKPQENEIENFAFFPLDYLSDYIDCEKNINKTLRNAIQFHT